MISFLRCNGVLFNYKKTDFFEYEYYRLFFTKELAMDREDEILNKQLVSACWQLCAHWFFWYLFFYCLVTVVFFLLVFCLTMYFPESVTAYLSSSIVQSFMVILSFVCDVFFWCFSFYLSFSNMLKRSGILRFYLSQK